MVYKLLAFLLLCNVCFADSQKITAFEDKDVPVINTKFSDISSSLGTHTSQINNIKLSGFGIVLGGRASVDTDVIPSRFYLPVSGTFRKIIAYAKTAPTGDDIIIDVNLNGTTILDATKIVIPATENGITVTTFSETSFSADDYLTVDIDQIGSTISGADIVLSFYISKATS